MKICFLSLTVASTGFDIEDITVVTDSTVINEIRTKNRSFFEPDEFTDSDLFHDLSEIKSLTELRAFQNSLPEPTYNPFVSDLASNIQNYEKIPTAQNFKILKFRNRNPNVNGNYADQYLWKDFKISANFKRYFPPFPMTECKFGENLIAGECRKWIGCEQMEDLPTKLGDDDFTGGANFTPLGKGHNKLVFTTKKLGIEMAIQISKHNKILFSENLRRLLVLRAY